MANGTSSLTDAVEILQLISTFEPAVVSLFKGLLTSLSGKSTEEILAEENTAWDDIRAKARAEQGLPPAPAPLPGT